MKVQVNYFTYYSEDGISPCEIAASNAYDVYVHLRDIMQRERVESSCMRVYFAMPGNSGYVRLWAYGFNWWLFDADDFSALTKVNLLEVGEYYDLAYERFESCS